MLNVETPAESRAYPYARLELVVLRGNHELELHFGQDRIVVRGQGLRHVYYRVISHERATVSIDPSPPTTDPSAETISGIDLP